MRKMLLFSVAIMAGVVCAACDQKAEGQDCCQSVMSAPVVIDSGCVQCATAYVATAQIEVVAIQTRAKRVRTHRFRAGWQARRAAAQSARSSRKAARAYNASFNAAASCNAAAYNVSSCCG